MFRFALPTLRSTCCRRSFSTTQSIPAGHNKWSKIKEKKGVIDAQRGQLLSRVARDIAIAIRTGGSADPGLNAQLSGVIKKAREQDVPKDNIERAIERAQGKNKKGEVVTYEALAFESVGIIIESLTDNLNRTIGNLREIFNDHGVQKASVMWMFKKVGRVDLKFPKPQGSSATGEQDVILEIAFGNDMEDFDVADADEEGKQLMKLYCPPERVAQLAEAVSTHPSVEFQERKILYMPENPSDSSLGEEVQEKLTKLLDRLWADEDTLNVWTTTDKP
ncbi:YebC-like protein [Macrolepiota fuliginosa MF-IS2]|uniref:YebC-like protein n=1 Tax=Macrolepiota fuliginosa MF-IS2 TaxID=1400762 RepID=A0A9P5XBK0_9AGAR|nr:YebC-like protein [Macrolepiota fuliginosa MF-IS2]